jgi:hypothetical protein
MLETIAQGQPEILVNQDLAPVSAPIRPGNGRH